MIQLQKIKQSPFRITGRLKQLQDDHLSTKASLGAERAIHYTEFFKKNAKKYDSKYMKMAQALYYHLNNRSIRIYPGEIIIGTHTEHRIGAICQPELAGTVMLEDLFSFEKRSTNPLHIDKKSKSILLKKVIPYWLSKNVLAKSFSTAKGLKYSMDQLKATFYIINEAGGIAHFLPDYEKLINKGTNGIRKQINKKISEAENLTPQNRDYLKASLVSLDAVEVFADRYKKLAFTQGNLEIVEMLENVPRKPASSLKEALQQIWFFQMIIQIESLDQGISLGRIDQYLYPIYQKEIKAKVFSENDFKETFAAFCLKLSEVIPLFSKRMTKLFGGLPSGQALTIGGIGKDNKCAANELTYMILDVIEGFKTRQPNWHARISKRSCDKYVKRAIQVVAGGGGSPALYNDDVIIGALTKRKIAKPRAQNYATIGCVEPGIPGESFTSSDAAIFNLPIALEIILGEGKRISGGLFKQQSGKNKTRLKDIQTFDTLMELVEVELAHQISYLKKNLDKIEKGNADFHPTPFSSLLIKGCIESALDSTEGGALFNASGIQGIGLADLADSLAAIKTVVFDKKEHSLEEVAQACRNDFKNFSTLKAKLIKAPKFGNDDAQVDEIAARIAAMFDKIVSSYKNTRGGDWIPGAYSMTCHNAFGANMAALPSGRGQQESLADGLAPSDGSDMAGPTASLNSVTRIDHEHFPNGVNLNIKFSSNIIRGKKGSDILRGLVTGYFNNGGMQVQVNVLDKKLLEDAIVNPDKHRNMLVRISGYSAYFTDLTPQMQREVIDRTFHGC